MSTATLLNDFQSAPTSMMIQRHLFGMVFAPNDFLTFVAILPYLDKRLDNVDRNGVNFEVKTQGPGDLTISNLLLLWKKDGHRLHFQNGFSLPTGNGGLRDDTPLQQGQLLPYNMQLGSGTLDFLPGLTYFGNWKSWSWGTQVNGKIRMGENPLDHRFGHRFEGTTWVARKWTEWFSTSFRLKG